MRAVPVAGVVPSVTVNPTRNVPGARAAKSKDADPPTTVALAAASSSTRTDSSEISPAVPVTCGVTSTVRPASIVSTTAKDCTVERRLRRDPHEERLRRDLADGVGDGDVRAR